MPDHECHKLAVDDDTNDHDWYRIGVRHDNEVDRENEAHDHQQQMEDDVRQQQILTLTIFFIIFTSSGEGNAWCDDGDNADDGTNNFYGSLYSVVM